MQNETPFLIEDGDINMDIVKLDRWLKDYKSRTDLIKLKPGERMCAYCNRKVAYPDYFKCRYCDEVVCSDHRVPESHKCPKRPLSPWEKEIITGALRGGS
jgi:predicted nucleic acid binding AN1-type Zn finger protein